MADEYCQEAILFLRMSLLLELEMGLLFAEIMYPGLTSGSFFVPCNHFLFHLQVIDDKLSLSMFLNLVWQYRNSLNATDKEHNQVNIYI